MDGSKDIICWWSGGVTSAVACKIAIDIYGIERCKLIMIDTENEDDDTYRFKADCEKWYGKKIEIISAIGEKYNSIQDVWKKHLSLNVATGAICSTVLKRKCREDWQKTAVYDFQVFGFCCITKKKISSLVRANHRIQILRCWARPRPVKSTESSIDIFLWSQQHSEENHLKN